MGNASHRRGRGDPRHRPPSDPAVEFMPRLLSDYATIARKNARKRLSPHGTVRCSSLQRPSVRFAGCFGFSYLVAASSAGLLIPRSQVRSLPGPFTTQRCTTVAQLSQTAGAIRASRAMPAPHAHLPKARPALPNRACAPGRPGDARHRGPVSTLSGFPRRANVQPRVPSKRVRWSRADVPGRELRSGARPAGRCHALVASSGGDPSPHRGRHDLRWGGSFALVDDETFICIIGASKVDHVVQLSERAGFEPDHVAEAFAIDALATQDR
jgi:hypothetical protein